MTMKLSLWHAWECPFSMQVRIVLAEKGLDYYSHAVALDDLPQEVRQHSPTGSVPLLKVDGLWVWESHIEAQLADDLAREPRLMPRTPQDRARVRMLLERCTASFQGPAFALEEQVLARPGTRDHHAALEARQKVREALAELSDALGEQHFLVGEYSIADIFYAPWIAALEDLGMSEEQVPPNVGAWSHRLSERPVIAEQVRLRLRALESAHERRVPR